MDYQTLIVTLILGSYAFTAGGYLFTWKVFTILGNHRREDLRKHLKDECDDDCYFCED